MRRAVTLVATVAVVGAVVVAAIYSVPAYREWAGVREYKARLASVLRDPESAQFGALKLVDNPGRRALCGNVNARNAFGGYVGFRSFIVTDTTILMQPDSELDGTPNRDETIAVLQKQLDYLNALKRYCYNETDVAAADSTAGI